MEWWRWSRSRKLLLVWLAAAGLIFIGTSLAEFDEKWMEEEIDDDAINPCDKEYLGIPEEACYPCHMDSYNLMLAPTCVNKMFFGKHDTCDDNESGEEERVSVIEVAGRKKKAAGCYNSKPVIVEFQYAVETEIAEGVAELDLEIAALGFNIPENPFFRYFLPPKTKARAAEELKKNKTTAEYDKFDIGLVKDLYLGHDQKEDTDFELLEWPGKTSNQVKDHLDLATIKSYGCKDDAKVEIPDTDPKKYRCSYSHNFTILHYDGEASKFLNYPCNKKLGSNIVAFAQVQQTDDFVNGTRTPKDADLNDTTNDPIQKIWLSHGTDSIHRKYTQPIYIRFATLQKLMAPAYVTANRSTGATGGVQNLTDIEWSCGAGDPQINLKLRTLYDFAFTTDGLVLGMHCGVVVLKGLVGSVFVDSVPTLTSRYGRTTGFPKPINRLSSSVCCLSGPVCRKEKHIVAAYSFSQAETETTKKYLYLSFDQGNTFEEKFVSTRVSLINLIQSMYNMYERFIHYYELLNQCEPFEGNANLENSQESKMWSTLNAEEKEAYVQAHIKSGLERGTNDEFHDTLGRLYCQETLNKSNGFSHRRNLAPKWVKKLIAQRYAKYFKPNGYRVRNAEECQQHPVCGGDQSEKLSKYVATVDETVDEILSVFPPETGVNPDANCNETDERFDWYATLENTFKRDPIASEPICGQIASIVIIEEDQNVLVVCKMSFCKGEGEVCGPEGYLDQSEHEEKVLKDNVYAVYLMDPPAGVPIVELEPWSEFYFECDLMKYVLGGKKEEEKLLVQPEILRVPRSTTIVIKNCLKTIYYSFDMGKTVNSFAFYTKKYKAANVNANPTNGGRQEDGYDELGESQVEGDTKWVRTFRLQQLTVPPMMAASGDGLRLLFTFKNYYAMGQIDYKKNSFLSVGISFRKPRVRSTVVGKLIPEETIAIPWFKNSGDKAISVSMLGFFARDELKDYDQFYKDRHSIRLVEIPINYYHHEAAFFTENHGVTHDPDGEDREIFTFEQCTTFRYKYTPEELKLDVRETGRILVSVIDADQDLSLAVYAASKFATDIHVNKLSPKRKKGEGDEEVENSNKHIWEVLVSMNPEPMSQIDSDVDAFFGGIYSRLEAHSPTVVMHTASNSRCHVQPVGSVFVSYGCHEKIMVAHEDEHRPQKAQFIKTKKYTIRKGKYNPELARYWIENTPNFVERNEDGDLIITYDYSTFGIPIEPFKDDPFTPDLRIVDEKMAYNSTRGTIYRGDFVLIEIFGAEGFDYARTVGHYSSGCKQPPQTLKQMLEEWIHRRRIFNISAGRMKRFLNSNPESEGSALFDPLPVYEQVNIWNRVNYQHCRQTNELDEELDEILLKDEEIGLTEDSPLNSSQLEALVAKVKEKHRLAFEAVKEDRYEIMNNKNLTPSESLTCDGGEHCNTLLWHSKDRPEVLIFLAVAVDNYESLCNYYTFFAVSLPKAQELDDTLSFLCFVIFTVFWVVAILFGFFWRKNFVRQKYVDEARMERLKQAAWTVVYRYEKLLHENENKQLESEIDEFSKILHEKDAAEAAAAAAAKIESGGSKDLKSNVARNNPQGK